MTPLGKHQIELLRQMANPWLRLIVGDKTTESLVKRGLLAPRSKDKDSFYQITPAGMRAVADLWEAKKIKFERPKKPKRRKGRKASEENNK